MALSVKEFLLGATKVYEATDVGAAVALAQTFKAEGRYQWFRGQVRMHPPTTSLQRAHQSRDEARIERTQHRFELFVQWAKSIPELRYLIAPENAHDCFAIMQHYGMPTNYLDFSTDPSVAGFFAADTKDPPRGKLSCIYCLDIEDLQKTWGYLAQLEERKGGAIELVTIDVRNLWRLKAQSGVFVYTNYDWAIDYPLDRITFPASGYPEHPTRELVYPEHKSPLEQLLDQYFSLEQATFTNEKMREWLEAHNRAGGHGAYTEWTVWPNGYYEAAFPDASRMAPLESWERTDTGGWNVDPEEQYHDTVGTTLELSLTPTGDPHEMRDRATLAFGRILETHPGLRSKAVEWILPSSMEPSTSAAVNRALRPAWNGMRRLPYLDVEIADALGAIVAMIATRDANGTPDVDRERFTKLFGDLLDVGFSNHDKSGSRGWIARTSLDGALRKDMCELLAPEHRHRSTDVTELFRVIYNPALMFPFDAFKAAFAREVIPAQVLLDRSPILFNPARLIVFGNP